MLKKRDLRGYTAEMSQCYLARVNLNLTPGPGVKELNPRLLQVGNESKQAMEFLMALLEAETLAFICPIWALWWEQKKQDVKAFFSA